MGANIGTTVTGLLVALKNDYFNMLMYLLAFAGVMMGFVFCVLSLTENTQKLSLPFRASEVYFVSEVILRIVKFCLSAKWQT